MKNVISMEDLRYILHDEDLVIFDCSFDLSSPDKMFLNYQTEHLPNAIYAHLEHDLSGPVTDLSGRHPLPLVANFKKWLMKLGVSLKHQIVIYDNFNGGLAARLWFMLSQLGYTTVSLYLGGLAEWKVNGLPTESGFPKPRKSLEELNVQSDWKGRFRIYSSSEVNELIDSEQYNLIDSRSPERYQGEVEPYDSIAGHIPSAKNHFWKLNLDGIRPQPTEYLQTIFKELIPEYKTSIFYCGSGVTACFNLFIADQLGLFAGIYIGSWSEWLKNYPDKITQET
ncbi:MAG: sulfurtransferase [Candidatus Heimdallarchaeota archaeon]|nr:sulfurtransferase [Candidatus Heimdallarchaeota archaeon]